MNFTSDNIISEGSFYVEKTFELPKRFKEEKYTTSFNLLKSWDLLRTFSIISYKLTFDYIHLLDQEQFDENQI